MLADLQNIGAFQNVGGFPKYWRFEEIQADLQKCWRLAEIQADNRILADVEISAPGEISADLEKVGGPLTVWARRNLQLLTSSWTG